MVSYDGVGRIPRQAFVKEFALDDAFLAFGTSCLIAAMAVLYINMDNMYLTEALTYAPALFATQPPDLNRVFEFRKLVTASLILTWVAMMAVKFSFLALFRRLIDRIPGLIKYWWFVVVFNLAVTGYGASVYVVACPHFSGPKVIACLGGATRHKTIQYALSQLVLDVVGDLLILYIPFQLIWKVKIKMLQKLTLACSLCLTVVVIVFTVTRASGLEWKGNLDVLWEVYFQIVAAEVGLILVSMTAFRQLFVSRTARNQQSPPKSPSFWMRSRNAMRRLLDPRKWTSGYSKGSSHGQKHGNEKVAVDFNDRLPSVPGATMTGVQTFINHQGDIETAKSIDDSSSHSTVAEAEQHTWPLADQETVAQGQGQQARPVQTKSYNHYGARPLESTGDDTLTSVIGMYQDGSQRG
ncbi:hypothetical protein G7Y79_00007g022570 [Physcia stellaris]|nr:hypothetical protein G7Y79_00007g022570 [Physcia stellaris]